MTKAQHTGMTGTYLVAAELCRRDFNAVVTSRNMRGTDILVEHPETGLSASIQVKANRTNFDLWLVGDPTRSRPSTNRFFVLVNIRPDRNEFFVLPSATAVKVTKTNVRPTSTFHWIEIADVEAYRNEWKHIELCLKAS